MMSQANEQQMVMPAQPAVRFIVVEAEFAFAFFKDNFEQLHIPVHFAYPLLYILARQVTGRGRTCFYKLNLHYNFRRHDIFSFSLGRDWRSISCFSFGPYLPFNLAL
jgi:hypothetical protein